jgi:DNA-binding MarR family transcriptional regulator
MNSTSVIDENDPKPDRTIFALLHAAHTLEAKVGDALAEVGLSMPKFAVLNELVTVGKPLALSELAGRLGCVKSNMTQLVDRMETDGLVRRVDDPADRRAVKAEITPEGVSKQAEGARQVDKLHEAFGAVVGAEDRAALGRMLAALDT